MEFWIIGELIVILVTKSFGRTITFLGKRRKGSSWERHIQIKNYINV